MNRTAVWQILRDECGALPIMPPDFLQWPECGEYRFMGALGFGGKVWHQRYADMGHRIYVTCYSEDRTSERLKMIERTNLRLAELAKEANGDWR